MLLKRLVEYAGRLKLPPTLYAESPVRYVIALDSSGELESPVPIDTSDPGNPRTKRGQLHPVPRVQRAMKIRPLLLADNAEYTLGLARPDSDRVRVEKCRRAYLDQVGRCAQAAGDPDVAAVHRFLASEPVTQLQLPDTFDPSANITFQVQGRFVVDLPGVQRFWADENAPDIQGEETAPRMQCVICGQERPVLRRLQTKIKGLPGGQSSGTSIISANADAFESYGLEASLIAPTCATCGERFTLALNELIHNESTHVSVGNSVLVFWTRTATAFSLRSLLDRPDPGQVRELVESARKGSWMPRKVDSQAFFAASLTANVGRAVVRDWIDTTVEDVKLHLGRWFQEQAIVDAWGAEPRPLGVYALAAATARDVRKDLVARTPRALWDAALQGTPLPMELLYQAVQRNRAERQVTRQRAALIKLVLQSRDVLEVACGSPRLGKEDGMVQLDPHNDHPAYLCGRLLAVIEEAQRLAVPGIKATVVDRFFGTASSAPASVFGRLLRGAQPHLAKLKRDKPGAFRIIDGRLMDIQEGLQGFPRILSLGDQGLFALGYYHQRAFDRAAAREAKARKTARGAQAALEEGLEGLADLEENSTEAKEE
jgi:CRISPR-associated protein Csd1